MKCVKIGLVIFLGIMFFSLSAKVMRNEIVKVLHHKVIEKQPSVVKNMELGNLVFYFSGKPIVNFIPERQDSNVQNDKITKVFIFPYAHIKDTRMVNVINDDAGNKKYRLRIEKVDLPIKGVKFSLTYDPKKIAFDYKLFKSISNFQGVVFSFYNQNLIDKLQIGPDSVLRTTWGAFFSIERGVMLRYITM